MNKVFSSKLRDAYIAALRGIGVAFDPAALAASFAEECGLDFEWTGLSESDVARILNFEYMGDLGRTLEVCAELSGQATHFGPERAAPALTNAFLLDCACRQEKVPVPGHALVKIEAMLLGPDLKVHGLGFRRALFSGLDCDLNGCVDSPAKAEESLPGFHSLARVCLRSDSACRGELYYDRISGSYWKYDGESDQLLRKPHEVILNEYGLDVVREAAALPWVADVTAINCR